MALPTNQEIDQAVPSAGTPNRAKTNAVLKDIAKSIDGVNTDIHDHKHSGDHDNRYLRKDVPDDGSKLQNIPIAAVNDLSQLVDSLQSAGPLPTYKTKSAMNADTSQTNGTVGRVVSDGNNNGYYYWDGAAWSLTESQPASSQDISNITILVKDSLRQSVEAASGGHQTVIYTEKGQPSYVTIFPSYTLDSLNMDLGTGIHPGFVVGGAQKGELFVGSYPGRIIDDELVSLPGFEPTVSRNHDQFVTAARACGAGWHCITNAEWMAIALWSLKNGTMPNGNNNYGRDYVNTWETARRVDGGTPGDTSGNPRTLTGSGPASWRHDHTLGGIADLNGNVWEWAPGLRLNNGEIQIIPDNDAALDNIDLSPSSTEWKAILASDGSLVAPGTSGTLKYDSSGASSGSPVLSDTINNYTGNLDENNSGDFGVSEMFKNVTESGIVVPDLAKILGLFPPSGYTDNGRLYVRNHGERLPIRGGSWSNTSNAGLFALYLDRPRSHSNASFGSRPVFVI